MKAAQQTNETNSRGRLLQRGLRLEYLSLSWNVMAGTAAVITGLSTASVALLGFGLDVAIDSVASLILVWLSWLLRISVRKIEGLCQEDPPLPLP